MIPSTLQCVEMVPSGKCQDGALGSRWITTQFSIFGEVANESKSHNEFEEEAAAVPFIFVAVNTETEAESDYLPEVKKEVAEDEVSDNVGVLGFSSTT
ncbi:uncharacterized protein [Periplaneta americana]|uniref:uncharacterized protein isoform X2 n=1 Tax=Periplaneta americana TaxID=6978 RepID=UPI0037E7B7A0